jgi:hypothetical protein
MTGGFSIQAGPMIDRDALVQVLHRARQVHAAGL